MHLLDDQAPLGKRDPRALGEHVGAVPRSPHAQEGSAQEGGEPVLGSDGAPKHVHPLPPVAALAATA